MTHDQESKDDKFELNEFGEEIQYISLMQARLLAIKHARENPEIYPSKFSGVDLVWEMLSAEEDDDYYHIKLSWRPSGRFEGEPGVEEFIIDKMGSIELRQLLDEPSRSDDFKLRDGPVSTDSNSVDEEPGVRSQVASALRDNGVRLAQLDRDEEAIEVYDKLIERYSVDEEPAVRAVVARAIRNKGMSLGELGRSEEAIGVYDGLIERYSDDEGPEFRTEVTTALWGKGVILGNLGRSEEAFKVYDELIERYADDREPGVRTAVAEALRNKGFELGALRRCEEAIKVNDELIERYADDEEPSTRQSVAWARQRKRMLEN